MTRYVMVIDVDRCLGCGACVAACIAENLNSNAGILEFQPKPAPSLLRGLLGVRTGKPPAEYFVEKAAEETDGMLDKNPDAAKEKAQETLNHLWLRTEVYEIIGGKYPNVGIEFYHRICQHCDNAPCVTVCPTGASFQREDGIVLVDPDKCILCGACVTACPYAARQVNLLLKTIDKCTFCAHRVDRGLLPACVETCPAHVRIFGDLDDPNSEVSRIIREYHAVPGTPHGPIRHTAARVYYVTYSRYKVDVPEVEKQKREEGERMQQIEKKGWNSVKKG
jgi:tetrathionate reductase subunit B